LEGGGLRIFAQLEGEERRLCMKKKKKKKRTRHAEGGGRATIRKEGSVTFPPVGGKKKKKRGRGTYICDRVREEKNLNSRERGAVPPANTIEMNNCSRTGKGF